jgi:murein DD-endopeptidase MepM/ murein hydrolase activator NlpD
LQVASLGSIAGEVSALYGLKAQPTLVTETSDQIHDADVSSSLDQLHALRTSALSGATMVGLTMGLTRNATTADWIKANAAPNLWPVDGPITGSFGERIDPFNGEGAFHSGVDIGSSYGAQIIAPADGIVTFTMIDHGNGVSTRYGHLSGFAVTAGQRVHRGDVIGYVGESGRSTGPHLHYEVRINDIPVNPYKYLRITVAQSGGFATGS